jgi:hypothetical protein
LEDFFMIDWRKSLPGEPPKQPEPLGFHLEVRLSEKGAIELKLSEQVALKLTPWLIALLILSVGTAGVWVWLTYFPRQVIPLPPPASVQSQK